MGVVLCRGVSRWLSNDSPTQFKGGTSLLVRIRVRLGVRQMERRGGNVMRNDQDMDAEAFYAYATVRARSSGNSTAECIQGLRQELRRLESYFMRREAVESPHKFSPECPNCGAEGERQRKKEGKWVCLACGERHAAEEIDDDRD